ncbi:MAG TPA: extracellular solute-binding protein [Micromonosporaceae bacterium]|nr:extracellular solute-binding protein [Micromonosporaceae bacterium]
MIHTERFSADEPSVPGVVSRRTLLRGTAAAVAGLGLSACGGPLLSSTAGGRPVEFWNLFAGGDGLQMAALLDAFRKENPEVGLEAVTLAWGAPYYTKVAMAAAGGRAPDVAVLHLARKTGFAPGQLLDPFDEDLLAEVGLREQDFLPNLWNAAKSGDRLYAVPLDTHPLIMYYNTDVCGKAGLLGSDGKLAPIQGADAWLDAFAKAKAVTGHVGMAYDTQDVMPWRLFWGLYRQLDGEIELPEGGTVQIDEQKALRALEFMQKVTTTPGLAVPSIDYPGAVATFTGGQAGFMWNGGWEVSTMQTAKLPFSMTRFPNIFGSHRTQGDSHSFVLPHQRDRDPQATRDAYNLIAFIVKNSADWAKVGHIPAWIPATESAEYESLQPQSEYREAAGDVQLDPEAWFSGSASSLETQAGAAFSGVHSGELTPQAGLTQFIGAMNKLLDTPSPV